MKGSVVMTLQWLKERLKEEERVKLYSEQIKGIQAKFGEDVFCHMPIKCSNKENILSAIGEKNFFLLHGNGKIDSNIKPNENNFFGIYVWYDPEPNLLLAFF